MEQYYDQVIKKEMVAAELDCTYAEKAIKDLIGLERDNQLLGLNGEANGEIIPLVDDLPGKIGEKCKKTYSISGGAGDFSGTGTICDIEQPWTVTGSGVVVTYTPSSANGGTYSYSGSMSGFTVSGTGQYTVTYADSLAVSIQAGGQGSAGDAQVLAMRITHFLYFLKELVLDRL